MKKVLFLLTACVALLCETWYLSVSNQLFAQVTSAPQPAPGWLGSFRAFRNAVYQKNMNKVKDFVAFANQDESNEVWGLIYNGGEKRPPEYSGTARPFTEKDLEKHFSKIFTGPFIKAILKIKSEDLYRRGSVETAPFIENNTRYMMIAEFDKKTNTLTLNLSATGIPEKAGEEAGEFSIMYQFEATGTGQIRLVKILMAG